MYLLKVVPPFTCHGMISYSLCWQHFHGTEPVTLEAVAQFARRFLLYVLVTTLFANRENTVGLYLLSGVVELERVREFNWGGASLTTLYRYMISVSR